MRKYIPIIILLIAFGAILAKDRMTPQQPNQPSKGLGEYIANQNYPYLNIATGTSTPGTSILLLATSTTRQYARICNDSSANKIYLMINGGGQAVIGNGILLNSLTCFQLSYPDMITGAIYGVASSSPASTTISALQQ